MDGGGHGVEVEPRDAGALLVREVSVVLAEPVYELLELLVAPHPLWEVVEDGEFGRGLLGWVVADVAVDDVCVWGDCQY